MSKSPLAKIGEEAHKAREGFVKEIQEKRKRGIAEIRGDKIDTEGLKFEKTVARFLNKKYGWNAEVKHNPGLGYDVIATTPNGRTIYVECKSGKETFQPSQLAAAQKYGRDWIVAVKTNKGPQLQDVLGNTINVTTW